MQDLELRLFHRHQVHALAGLELADRVAALLDHLVDDGKDVSVGQFLALSLILILMTAWRRTSAFQRHVVAANAALMCAGFVLIGYQLSGFFIKQAT